MYINADNKCFDVDFGNLDADPDVTEFESKLY